MYTHLFGPRSPVEFVPNWTRLMYARPPKLKVCHFKANIELKWPTSKLSGHGKTIPKFDKNRYALSLFGLWSLSNFSPEKIRVV